MYSLRRLFRVVACATSFWGVCHSNSWSEEVSPPRRLLPERLAAMERVVAGGIADGEMAGCVVLVGRRDEVLYRQAFGHRQLEPEPLPMTVETLFDLASLTKPIATGTSVLRLVDAGQLELDAPVARYLPEFGRHGKEQISIRDLLVHRGGLIPDNALDDYMSGPEMAWQKICDLPLESPVGSRFRYSDVGFIVLGKLVEQVSGKSLAEYTRTELFEPLQMRSCGYLPGQELRDNIAATERIEGEWRTGTVHDPRAAALGGVAGHAGLFATADDLARFARMVLQDGSLDDARILGRETVRLMTEPQTSGTAIRGLGWDKDSGYSINRGDLLSARAIGHGGFTGTAFWIDPGQDLYVIFLSNRLHPDGKGAVNSLAGRIATLAAAALVPTE